MLFHRRQHAQFTLHPSGVVIMDIGLNHLDKFTFAGKPSAVIAFPLQDAPEALHRTIVNALANAGHTLGHACSFQLCVEDPICILEPSVAVKQRMGVRGFCHSLVKGLKNQCVIVPFTNDEGHDTSVKEIQYRAEIELVDLKANIVLEFRHISQPLCIRPIRIKLPLQNILCQILRLRSLPCTAMVAVLDG